MVLRVEWSRREVVAVETITDTEGASKYLAAQSVLAIFVEKFHSVFKLGLIQRGGFDHLNTGNMASMPAVISDAIALTEKKMDMTLDDIIKMSKKSTLKAKRQRMANKRQRIFANNFGERKNASKANTQLSVSSRSSTIRQGKLAGRRSRNGGSQFSAVKEAARRAALMPIRPRLKWNRRRVGPQLVQRNVPYQVPSNPKVNGAVTQRPHTLDSLFANMKEQRMRVQAQTGRRPRNYAPQQRNFYGRQRNLVGRPRNYMGRQRAN